MILRFLFLTAVVTLFASCTTVGRDTGYDFCNDALSSMEAATVPEVHEAALKALEQLEMPVRNAKYDDLISVISTKTADGSYFKVVTEWRSETSSKVMVETYQFCDRYKALGILVAIRDQLAS
jgi:hypothetical protein